MEVLGWCGKGLVGNTSNGYVLCFKPQRLTDMGRGLSDLQSTILCLAYKNRIQRDRSRAELVKLRGQLKRERRAAMDDIRAYHSPANATKRKERKELLRKIHHLKKDDSIKRNTDLLRREVLIAHWDWKPAKPEGWMDQRFSKVQLGERYYNTVLSSLSRALARLKGRGLVVMQPTTIYGPAKIDLTDRGLEEALKTNGEHLRE